MSRLHDDEALQILKWIFILQEVAPPTQKEQTIEEAAFSGSVENYANAITKDPGRHDRCCWSMFQLPKVR